MGIGDPGGEELIGGKQRLGAGALEHDRDRSGGTRGLGSGQQGSLGRGTVHGDLGNDNYLYRALWRVILFFAPAALTTATPDLLRAQVKTLQDLIHTTR